MRTITDQPSPVPVPAPAPAQKSIEQRLADLESVIPALQSACAELFAKQLEFQHKLSNIRIIKI